MGFIKLQQTQQNQEDSDDNRNVANTYINMDLLASTRTDPDYLNEELNRVQCESSSESEEEDEAVTRLEKICECTHKILAKYTSNGMIKYSVCTISRFVTLGKL